MKKSLLLSVFVSVFQLANAQFDIHNLYVGGGVSTVNWNFEQMNEFIDDYNNQQHNLAGGPVYIDQEFKYMRGLIGAVFHIGYKIDENTTVEIKKSFRNNIKQVIFTDASLWRKIKVYHRTFSLSYYKTKAINKRLTVMYGGSWDIGKGFLETQLYLQDDYQELVSLKGWSLSPALVVDYNILPGISIYTRPYLQWNLSGRREFYEPLNDVTVNLTTDESKGYTSLSGIGIEFGVNITPILLKDIKLEKKKREEELIAEDPEPAPEPEITEQTDVSPSITGEVKDAETGERLKSHIKVVDKSTGKVVFDNDLRADEQLSLKDLKPNTEYVYETSSEGHVFKSGTVTTDDAGNKNIVIGLQKIKVGSAFTMKNVLFEQNKANLLDESKLELDELVKFLTENPNVKIQLEGHTEYQKNTKRLEQLSEDRVLAVKKYLEEKGINGKRIKTVGYGSKKPITKKSDKQSQSLNRRVEYRIISN